MTIEVDSKGFSKNPHPDFYLQAVLEFALSPETVRGIIEKGKQGSEDGEIEMDFVLEGINELVWGKMSKQKFVPGEVRLASKVEDLPDFTPRATRTLDGHATFDLLLTGSLFSTDLTEDGMNGPTSVAEALELLEGEIKQANPPSTLTVLGNWGIEPLFVVGGKVYDYRGELGQAFVELGNVFKAPEKPERVL